MSLSEFHGVVKRKKLLAWCGALGFAVFVTLGVFASNGWLPHTDPLSGKKTGWFGKELPKHATSAWSPFPPPTPQLSKEYIHAGSRLLAVEDANATTAPPADIAIWRPSSGVWWVMGQQGSQAVTFGWGVSVDIPVPGDYDGDGKTDFSVFRPNEGIWYIYPSAGGGWITYSWGLSTDLPAPADYDGDGRTDAAVMRQNGSTGYSDWYIRQSSDNTFMYRSWGTSTDIPGPADFDGDGRADIAVYRPGTQHYYSINSTDGAFQFAPMGTTVNCSIPNRCVVPSDFDGDGRADYALYNSSASNWTIRSSTTGQTATTQWGAANDIPVQNDYDGDGKTDLATFKDNASPWARWLIKRSSNGTTRTEYWGEPGDIPVPAFYRR